MLPKFKHDAGEAGGARRVDRRMIPALGDLTKVKTFRSEAWLEAVRSVPYCVLCKRACQPQAAHKNEGKGKSIKTSDACTAALCADCHVRIDQGTDLTKEERRGLINAAIVATIEILSNNGLIGVVNVHVGESLFPLERGSTVGLEAVQKIAAAREAKRKNKAKASPRTWRV